MKPSLTVFLAAGCSLSFGVPNTKTLTDAVIDAIRDAEALLPPPLTSKPTRTDLLWDHLKGSYGPNANFEHVLHSLESMDSLIRTWQATLPSRYLTVEGVLCCSPVGSLLDCFDRIFPIVGTDALYNSIFHQIATANASLSKHPNWSLWTDFIRKLRTQFDTQFVTTNYDHLLEDSAAFLPEDEGFFPISGECAYRFDPKKASLKLMHLHGNIRFGYRSNDNRFIFEDDFYDLYWFNNPDVAADSWSGLKGRSIPTSGAGDTLNVGPIITGLHKPDKLLIEPYRSYSEAFYTSLRQTPCLLVIGYGFGDPHLNYILQRMTRWHGSNRRVIYVGWNDNWPPDPHDFSDNLRTISYWAEEDSPMKKCLIAHKPYIPSGGGHDCFRGWFTGFNDVLQHHQGDVIDFLKS